jgi:hypothetical protein
MCGNDSACTATVEKLIGYADYTRLEPEARDTNQNKR